MDVFAIEKGKALKLSVDEFEKQTCHDFIMWERESNVLLRRNWH